MLEEYVSKVIEDEDLVSPHSFEEKTDCGPLCFLVYVKAFVRAKSQRCIQSIRLFET